jgi:hypothetical protein
MARNPRAVQGARLLRRFLALGHIDDLDPAVLRRERIVGILHALLPVTGGNKICRGDMVVCDQKALYRFGAAF